MRFSETHPLTQFMFFISVISSVILNRNPFFLFITLITAFCFRRFQHNTIKALKEFIIYFLITCICIIAIPLVSHNGKTALFFINDNAVTKEALFLGLCTGLEISSAVCWFACMSHLMSGEKIIFLISGISPRLAVFVSGIMRFIPMIKKQFRHIHQTQKNIYSGYKSVSKTVYVFFKSVSALFTWIIESSADTYDSMYARGYGLSKHRSINIYRLKKYDIAIMAAIVYILPFTAVSVRYRTAGVTFYPEINMPGITFANFIIFFFWTVLMMMPVLTEICEEYKWKLLRSKI